MEEKSGQIEETSWYGTIGRQKRNETEGFGTLGIASLGCYYPGLP
jgi:hypothetical protein